MELNLLINKRQSREFQWDETKKQLVNLLTKHEAFPLILSFFQQDILQKESEGTQNQVNNWNMKKKF